MSNKNKMFFKQALVQKEEIISTIYHVYIDDYIVDIGYYQNVISILNNANEDDVVVFHLSTDGGVVDTAVAICNAIRATEAKTISIIRTRAISAGTFFVMTTDSVIVMPHSFMMFHPAQYGVSDDMKNVKNFVSFQDNRLKLIFQDFYDGFFTDKEINDMVENRMEVWMDENEIIDRLKKRDKHQEILFTDNEDEGIIQEIPKIVKQNKGKK